MTSQFNPQASQDSPSVAETLSFQQEASDRGQYDLQFISNVSVKSLHRETCAATGCWASLPSLILDLESYLPKPPSHREEKRYGNGKKVEQI